MHINILIASWVFVSTVTFILETKVSKIKREIHTLKKKVITSSCIPSPINDGKLIHIDCPITKLHKFTMPIEFAAYANTFNGLFLDSEIEIFNIPFGIVKKGQWVSNFAPNVKNIEFIPYIPGVGRKFAPKFHAGSFILDSVAASKLTSRKLIELKNDKRYDQSKTHRPTIINIKNTYVHENIIYTGDPYNPSHGDIRIKFFNSAATHVSAIGYQKPGTLLSELGITEIDRTLTFYSENEPNKLLPLILEGDHTVESILNKYENDINPYKSYLNLMRGIFIIISCLYCPLIYSLQ